jgi:hypothetical protein
MNTAETPSLSTRDRLLTGDVFHGLNKDSNSIYYTCYCYPNGISERYRQIPNRRNALYFSVVLRSSSKAAFRSEDSTQLSSTGS